MRTKCAMAALAAAVLMLFPPPTAAQERVGIGYTMVDDGSCSQAGNTLTAEYDRESDSVDVRGMVRVAPSGGDCRQEQVSYDVGVTLYPVQSSVVDVALELGVNEQSASAPYALADMYGSILLRGDGGALFATNLPAGSARTIIAAVGLSREVGPVRITGGFNLVPVDWAMYESGHSVRLGAGYDIGGFNADASADFGAYANFGEVSAGYRHALEGSRFDVGIGLVYRWGIGAIDNGAPLMQLVNDSPFVRAGPPRDDSLLLNLTLGWSPS